MKNKNEFAIAACVTDLGGKVPSEIQLTLDGTFKAKDGRPANLDGWVINHDIAQALIQLANTQADAFVIDYEHQTLYAKQNGMPAPAAGFFKNLEYREGVGIFATNVEWTEAAASSIQAKEYRYISPVLQFNQKTGEVTKILMAALVNNPALDGMADLTALAADYFSPPTEALKMTDEVKNLQAKIADLEKQLSDSKAACAIANEKAKKTAACATETVDLSQYIPIADMKPLNEQIAALSAQIKMKDDADKVIEITQTVEAALSDGRLLPAQKLWAENLGKTNIAALKEYVAVSQPVAALSGTQTGGKAPDKTTKKDFKTASGWAVDEESAALHSQILAYQTEHKVDYVTAAMAIED